MSNIPTSGEMFVPPGGFPEGYVPSEADTPEAQGVQGPYQDFATSGEFSAEEMQTIESAANFMSSPQLEEPDKAHLDNLIADLRAFQTNHPGVNLMPVGSNRWLEINTVMALFEMTMEIIDILSQIKKQESELQINLALVKISMAKEIADLTVKLGEVAARQCILDAAKAWAEMGIALAQLVSTVVVTIARENALRKVGPGMKDRAEEAGEPPPTQAQIESAIHNEMTKWQTYQQLPGQFIEAAGKGVLGGLEFSKASLKLLEAEIEAARGQEQTFMEMITKEIDALRESRSEVAKQLKDFLETLANLIRTVGEQFRTGAA